MLSSIGLFKNVDGFKNGILLKTLVKEALNLLHISLLKSSRSSH
jgi:hypothetical protein